MKNNAWQHWNSSVLLYALSQSNLGNCNSIFDVPPNSCFGKYYHTIKFIVKATRLAKKVRKWFTDGISKSLLFCHNFMTIFLSLKTDEDRQYHTFQLHVFAYTGINLRDSVSLFSRVTISGEQVQNLQQVCSNFFRATALFLSSTPTSWTIGHVVPFHAKQLFNSLGMGLGINTMEGREAKHIALAQFTRNTQFSSRWAQVFRHEYVSLIWLRENGCDEIVNKNTSGVYIPKRCYTPQFCHCGQPKNGDDGKCSFCLEQSRVILLDCVARGKITNEAKALIQ